MTLRPLSASQIKAWLACQTKWAATYLGGIRDPESGGSAAGTRAHKMVEDWLVHGTPIDTKLTYVSGGKTYFTGKCAAAIVKHLPFEAGTVDPAHVERAFTLHVIDPDTGDRLPYRGFIDLDDPDGPVYDHKSCRGLVYAMKAPELRADVQAAMYALVRLSEGRDYVIPEGRDYVLGSGHPDDVVTCQWTYAETTDSPSSRPVKIDLTRAEAEHTFRTVMLPATRAIHAAYAANKPWREHKKNPAECGNYGGCGRRNDGCKVTANERGLAMLTRDQMMAKVREKAALKAAEVAPAEPKAPETTPADVATPEAPKMSRLDAIRAKARQINPDPKGPEPVLETGAVTEPEPVLETGPAVPDTDPEATPEPSVAPKRRGRPRKVTGHGEDSPLPKPEPALHVLYDADLLQGPEPETPGSASPEAGSGPEAGFVLYVDCAPIHGPVTHAYTLFAQAAAEVCVEADVPNIGLIDYGKGPAYLAAQVRANLEANPVTGALVTTKYTPEGKATLQVLCEMASNVVLAN